MMKAMLATIVTSPSTPDTTLPQTVPGANRTPPTSRYATTMDRGIAVRCV
jgi:hypothetical protein